MFTGAIHRLPAALCLALALGVPFVARAQVAVPPLAGHITDQTGTLTQEQISTLEQTLASFEARKGSQLAVLMVSTTAPEAIEPFALRVGEQWKLGRKKVDDGVILVVAKNDRTLRIEVGYGLEDALSDITSKRIISDTILPRFKQGDFYGGLQAGVDQIIRVVQGEALPASQNGSPRDGYESVRQFLPFLIIVAFALGGILRKTLGQVPGSLVTGVVVTVLAWFVVGTLLLSLLAGVAAMFVTLLGLGRMGHGMGGYSGGGGSGFGGGGFRGGGGGFGGGGASGRW